MPWRVGRILQGRHDLHGATVSSAIRAATDRWGFFMFSTTCTIRKTILAGLLGLVLSTSALATEPSSTGLGQQWPNATDVSASQDFHVYVFVRDGINYIQVNDSNGTVRAAYATAADVVLPLPVGVDAQNATVAAEGSDSSSAETVYSDDTTKVTVTPQANGSLKVKAMRCTDPYNCIGGAKQ